MTTVTSKCKKLTVLLPAAAFLFALFLVGTTPALATEESDAIRIVSADEFSDLPQEPEVNPDFIRWLDGEDFGGLIPDRYLFTKEADNRVPRVRAAVGPAKYDPREGDGDIKNGVTAVRDQGQVGACWAFATTALLESYIKKNYPVSGDPDFSEQHMRYALSTDGGNPFGFDRRNEGGGNMDQGAAYFTRQALGGPVLEIDDPYISSLRKPAASGRGSHTDPASESGGIRPPAA
jgi:C1A family cysteine protease